MYKEMIICIIIVALVISLDIISQKYTKNSIEIVSKELEKVEEMAKNDSIEKEDIKNKMEEVKSLWDEKKQAFQYYIEHDELEKVQTELEALEADIEMEEYENAVVDTAKAIFILEHIKEKYSLKIQNIF